MGVFDNLFNNKNKIVNETFINWIPLINIEDLDVIYELSKKESILIFKHSTRCGISRMVIKEFEKLFSEETKKIKIYYLDLLEHRNISNEVGNYFKVVHESPQLIIVRNGTVIEHSSHYDITQTNLSRFL
ncbi:MAG: Uncharacterised protein [Polaribacter sp. SA4-10]|nr:MAG: Uncharacterised protein [Polaribacter sp. SA4-10]